MVKNQVKYSIYDWETGDRIVTKDVSNLLTSYLQKFKLIELNFTTDLEKVEEIFALISKDFLEEKLTLEEYSSIGHYFFHKKGKQSQNTALFDATLAVSELLFYSQNKNYDLSPFFDDINFLMQKYYPNLSLKSKIKL